MSVGRHGAVLGTSRISPHDFHNDSQHDFRSFQRSKSYSNLQRKGIAGGKGIAVVVFPIPSDPIRPPSVPTRS